MNGAIGIDVGGSTIKIGVVNLETGGLIHGPNYVRTPQEPSLSAVIEAVAMAIEINGGGGPAPLRQIGIALPAIIRVGRYTAGIGLFPDWDGADALQLVEARLGRAVTLINDADAAGLAEMHFGYGQGKRGIVIVLTLGTFIGSALFSEGRLVPNTELGQLEVAGHPAELKLGGRAKNARGLTWSDWGEEFSAYLGRLGKWFSPDLIVLAGGMTTEASTFLPHVHSATPIKISRFEGSAGIVGAAIVVSGAECLPNPARHASGEGS